jgi:fucose permease
MMNLAHFFYGAGAVCSPVVATNLMAASFGEQKLGWRYMYLIILSFALIPIIPTLMGRLKKQDYDKKRTGYQALLKKPALWLSIMILALSAICEIGTVAWLANFLEKAYSFTAERAAFQLTLFFICFTLSRLIFGSIVDRIGLINALTIVTAFTGVLITTGVLLGEAGSVLLVIAGVGIAPIFPTVMAVTAKLFPDEVDMAMTAVITAMGIIMVPSNMLIGGIIQFTRPLFMNMYGDAGISYAYAAGYLFLGICCFGAFTFALLLRKRQKKTGQLV